jgi:secreted trypsin-like serine protease
MPSILYLIVICFFAFPPPIFAKPSWIVSIGYSNATSTHCAGTLLTKEWIVTTADCIKYYSTRDTSTSNNLRVFAGCSAGATSNCSSVHHVASVFRHPCYDGTHSNNLAMIRLMSPGVTMGRATRYPALPRNGKNDVRDYISTTDHAVVYGWGPLPSTPIRNITLPFIAPNTCRAKFLELDGSYSTNMDFTTPRVVCVGDGSGKSNLPCKDHTDLGTPLVQAGMDGAADVLVGVWTMHTPSPVLTPTEEAIQNMNSLSKCTVRSRFHVYTRISYYGAWLANVMDKKEGGSCASATVIAASGSLTHTTTSLSDVPIGIRYPWGDCPPSKDFLGANIADSKFVNAYGDSSLQNDRGERFKVFESEYDDGYAATSPVGTFPPIDTRRVSTTHHTYDMAGNVREWTKDVFVDDVYIKRASEMEVNVIVSNPHVKAHPVEGCHDVSCRRSVRGGSWADTCCHQLYILTLPFVKLTIHHRVVKLLSCCQIYLLKHHQQLQLRER